MGAQIVTISSSTSWEVGRDEPDETRDEMDESNLHALWQDLQKALIPVLRVCFQFFIHAFHTSCQARQKVLVGKPTCSTEPSGNRLQSHFSHADGFGGEGVQTLTTSGSTS